MYLKHDALSPAIENWIAELQYRRVKNAAIDYWPRITIPDTYEQFDEYSDGTYQIPGTNYTGDPSGGVPFYNGPVWLPVGTSTAEVFVDKNYFFARQEYVWDQLALPPYYNIDKYSPDSPHGGRELAFCTAGGDIAEAEFKAYGPSREYVAGTPTPQYILDMPVTTPAETTARELEFTKFKESSPAYEPGIDNLEDVALMWWELRPGKALQITYKEVADYIEANSELIDDAKMAAIKRAIDRANVLDEWAAVPDAFNQPLPTIEANLLIDWPTNAKEYTRDVQLRTLDVWEEITLTVRDYRTAVPIYTGNASLGNRQYVGTSVPSPMTIEEASSIAFNGLLSPMLETEWADNTSLDSIFYDKTSGKPRFGVEGPYGNGIVNIERFGAGSVAFAALAQCGGNSGFRYALDVNETFTVQLNPVDIFGDPTGTELSPLFDIKTTYIGSSVVETETTGSLQLETLYDPYNGTISTSTIQVPMYSRLLKFKMNYRRIRSAHSIYTSNQDGSYADGSDEFHPVNAVPTGAIGATYASAVLLTKMYTESPSKYSGAIENTGGLEYMLRSITDHIQNSSLNTSTIVTVPIRTSNNFLTNSTSGLNNTIDIDAPPDGGRFTIKYQRYFIVSEMDKLTAKDFAVAFKDAMSVEYSVHKGHQDLVDKLINVVVTIVAVVVGVILTMWALIVGGPALAAFVMSLYAAFLGLLAKEMMHHNMYSLANNLGIVSMISSTVSMAFGASASTTVLLTQLAPDSIKEELQYALTALELIYGDFNSMYESLSSLSTTTITDITLKQVTDLIQDKLGDLSDLVMDEIKDMFSKLTSMDPTEFMQGLNKSTKLVANVSSIYNALNPIDEVPLLESTVPKHNVYNETNYEMQFLTSEFDNMYDTNMPSELWYRNKSPDIMCRLPGIDTLYV